MLYLECILKCAQAGSFWLMLDTLGNTAFYRPRALIHFDLPLSVRTLRDLYTDNIEKVKVDSRKTYLRLIKFAEEFVPDIVPIIEHYTRERPLFEIYNIEDEIQKALGRKVSLKSGLHINKINNDNAAQITQS
jgi:Rne/Rng family ribonuclease